MFELTKHTGLESEFELSGFVLEKTVKLMKLSFSRILLQHPEIDITVDQWVIIQLIFQNQQLSQQELCSLAFKDAPTVTRIIDLLANKNLLLRNSDSIDRRKYNITLTEEGKEIYQKVNPIVNEFRAAAYSGIDSEELMIIKKISEKIFENLTKEK